MQSFTYVIAAYLVAVFMISTFTFKVVWERIKLRELLSLMGSSDDTKS